MSAFMEEILRRAEWRAADLRVDAERAYLAEPGADLWDAAVRAGKRQDRVSRRRWRDRVPAGVLAEHIRRLGRDGQRRMRALSEDGARAAAERGIRAAQKA